MCGPKLWFTVCSTVSIAFLVGKAFSLENLSLTQAEKNKLDQVRIPLQNYP